MSLVRSLLVSLVIYIAQAGFSWRASLSSSKLKSPPRVVLPSMHYELVYVLLTLALAHANAATTTVQNLGDYERLRHTSEAERKRLDELINTAAERLCRAAGILAHLSEEAIPNWETATMTAVVKSRPAETTREMTSALSKVCLADAERLAIRRLLTRAVSDSTITPGHPLPRSHPSPSLLAKLHINVSRLYQEANGLLSSMNGSMTPSDTIKKYVAEHCALTVALAHKWLGVDQGERDGAGEAVAWLSLAKEELKPLLKKYKAGLAAEVESIDSFLAAYKRLNDTVSFQPVPKPGALLAMVPGGRAALAIKPFQLPAPRFGGGRSDELELAGLSIEVAADESDSDFEVLPQTDRGTYF